ncbi:SAM-dependent methyltransferase [uncultured archaeon]|nr:SAM-dependent methyltransferase [uncultured archaeon]
MQDWKIEYFDRNYEDYDQWYDEHPKEFSDQVEFISSILPHGRGVEIGVGTGRFASKLGVEVGIDLSENMVKLASERGVHAILANAEHLPFDDNEFDYSLNMVTICFLSNPLKTLIEAKRVSRIVVTVILDRDSEYISNIMKERRGFYKFAKFYTRDELVELYKSAGISVIKVKEKVLRTMDDIEYKLVAVTGQ